MRLLLLVVLAVSCLELVRCDFATSVGNVTETPFYVKLLNKMIGNLQQFIEKSRNPKTEEDRDKAVCIQALVAIAKNIQSGWALSMIDSGSKLPSGILEGNIWDLGSYDQCLKVSTRDLDDPEIPAFIGRHCLITHRLYFPNGTMPLKGRKQNVLDLFGKPYVPFTLAQCFPSVCKPEVIEEGLNAVFSVVDNALDLMGVDIGLNVTVSPTDCRDKDSVPYDALDWVVLAFILLFLALGIISTAVDYFYIKLNRKKPSSRGMRILDSFSFYSNTSKLLSLKMKGDAIPSLNGLKFFSMCWVVIGHRYMYLNREPNRNMADIPDLLKSGGRIFIVNGPMAVDTFFMISAMLNMSGFLHERAKAKNYTIRNILSGYVHRYLRLTPAYLMMIAFTATWFYRLREGPLWERFVGEYKESCRKSFWVNLLYVNNYVINEQFPYCMIQSWYLAADMQFYWLSPLLMYPLWRWPRFGFSLFFVLVVASVIIPFLVSWYGHIALPIALNPDRDRRLREVKLLFYPMHTKSISYVLGIGAGYILYKYKTGEISLKMSLWKRVIGWLLCAAFMLYAIFGGYELYQKDYEYNQTFSAFFIGFQRFFWSSGLLWLVFMGVRDCGGIINTFLSWKVFTPLARLSYCVYLTHVVILASGVAAQKSSFFYEDYDQVERFLGDLVLAMFAGLILTLLVEAPMMNLEKILFERVERNPKNEEARTLPLQGHYHAT